MKSLFEFLVKNKPTNKYKDHNINFVDLGLPSGTLWGDRNIGAYNIEDFGCYYAWGEIKEKKTYTIDNYIYLDNKKNELKKYNVDDKLRELENNDDIAYITTHGDCVIPSSKQLNELIKHTRHEWVDNYNDTGASGCVFYSKKYKNEHIFIPAGGYKGVNIKKEDMLCMFYCRNIDETITSYTRYVSVDTDKLATNLIPRYYGLNVRPVKMK